MKSKCQGNCKFIYNIDLYGKEAELYYKGNNKKTSWTGRIIYVLMY